MAKIIRNVLIVVTILAVGFFVIFKLTSISWVYDLPNDYKIFRKDEGSVTIGKEIDGDFYTEYKDKKIGISEYVAQFQTNSNFVGVMTLVIKGEETVIKYYLIDTKDSSVYGPYMDEESYLAASGVWTDEGFNDWISTTEVPEGAYYK